MRSRISLFLVAVCAVLTLSACTADTAPEASTETKTVTKTTKDSWKIYRNDQYHYEIRRPDSWSVREYTEIQSPVSHLTGFDPNPLPEVSPEFAGTVAIQILDIARDEVIKEQQSLENFEQHGVSINQVAAIEITGTTSEDSLGGKKDIDYILFEGEGQTLMLMGTFMPDDTISKDVFRRMVASFRLR